MTDKEEAALIAAAEHGGSLRDQTILIIMAEVKEIIQINEDFATYRGKRGSPPIRMQNFRVQVKVFFKGNGVMKKKTAPEPAVNGQDAVDR